MVTGGRTWAQHRGSPPASLDRRRWQKLLGSAPPGVSAQTEDTGAIGRFSTLVEVCESGTRQSRNSYFSRRLCGACGTQRRYGESLLRDREGSAVAPPLV